VTAVYCNLNYITSISTLPPQPGSRPADIFGVGTKWCNLLLYLMITYVFENFEAGNCPVVPLLGAGLPQRCFMVLLKQWIWNIGHLAYMLFYFC